MASVTHDLHQFRYITSVRHPLPWTRVRHVSIPELRSESPDLPMMANLISALADCNVSLKEIREHNDADLVQLIEVLQACLQFALWSQNILKERMLELQSSQVARHVSARQLDHVEARCRSLTQDVAALTSERDTLALGTANLRTSLVQLETTVKMQERQLKQERERTSQLVAKLEKAFAERPPVRAPAAPAVLERDASGRVRCPTCGHRRHASPSHSRAPQGSRRGEVSPPPPARQRGHHLSSSATSDTDATSYTDSLMDAEGEVLCAESAQHRRGVTRYRGNGRYDGASVLFPPSPCLDWRTLVRYILHEETSMTRSPPLASTQTANTAMADALTTTQTAAASFSPSVSATGPSLVCTDVSNAVQTLFSNFIASVADEVGAFVRGTSAQTRELITVMSQHRLRELGEMQHAALTDLRATLHDIPLAAAAATTTTAITTPPIGATSTSTAQEKRAVVTPLSTPLRAQPFKAPSPVASRHLGGSAMSESSKEAVAHFMRSISEHSSDKAKTRDSPLSHCDYSALYRSREGSPVKSPVGSQSLFHSAAASPMPEARSQTRSPHPLNEPLRVTARDSINASRSSLLPAFSPSILRTPDASNDSSSSSSNSIKETSAAAAPSLPPPPFSSSSSDVAAASLSQTSNKTSAHTPMEPSSDMGGRRYDADNYEDDDGQSPDADFRLPTSSTSLSSSSRADSYQSSTEGHARAHSGSGERRTIPSAPVTSTTLAAAAAAAAGVSSSGASKTNLSFHGAPSARPATTPPVYPSLHLQQQQPGSPLTASASPGGFSLVRSVSLQSSMRSDASGNGSTHASSQMLRDTQRELEALLAEDAAAERAKTQK